MNRAGQVRTLVYALFETIENTAEWISTRENSRQSFQNSKMVAECLIISIFIIFLPQDENDDEKLRVGSNDLNTEMENDGQSENSSDDDEMKKWDTIQQLHQCDICRKTFKSARSLRLHTQTVHSGEKM